jgi:hypothetical protein
MMPELLQDQVRGTEKAASPGGALLSVNAFALLVMAIPHFTSLPGSDSSMKGNSG